MSFEDQLGNLATRLATARNDLEAALQHSQTLLHNRLDSLTALHTSLSEATASDVSSLHTRLRDIEEGVIRHRDVLLAEFRTLSGRVLSLEESLVSTRALGALILRISQLEDKVMGLPTNESVNTTTKDTQA